MSIARVSIHKFSMNLFPRWGGWMIVVVLWLLNAAGPTAGEDTVAQRIRILQSRSAAREASSLQDEQATALDLEPMLPRDISGTYRGEFWSDKVPDVPGLPHQRNGDFFYQINEVSSVLPLSATFFKGDLIVRNSDQPKNMNRMHHDMLLHLTGLYAPGRGTLLLYANTKDWQHRQEVKDLINGNLTGDIGEILSQHQKQKAHGIEESAGPGSECQTSIRLEVMPDLSSESFSWTGSTSFLLREGSPSLSEVNMRAFIHSESCDFSLAGHSVRVQSELFRTRASGYAGLVTGLVFAQIVFTLTQMQFSSTNSRAQRMSIGTFAMQALVDSFFCMFHLTTAIVVQSLWASFMMTSMLQFVLGSLFELRIIIYIHRSRNESLFNDTFEETRRQISLIYTKFYVFILCGLLFIFNLQNFPTFVAIIIYSYWVPQIIRNCVYDTSNALKASYIFGQTVTRLVVPFYFFGEPDNFEEIQTNYTFCFLIFVWSVFQCAVLLLQDRLGPRFFVPSRFLPPKYDYGRLPVLSDGDLCAICMMEIEVDTEEGLMVCPCNHTFHSPCLQQWMEQKMECPSCRGVLPSI